MSNRIFDAFTNLDPLPDDMTFGHFTPCKSYTSFGISTYWSNPKILSDHLQYGTANNIYVENALSDVLLWLNWNPNGMSAAFLATSLGYNTAVQMIGAPQFFPSTLSGTTVTGPSGTPVQLRPMRTSVRISCTTPVNTRAGGVSAVIVPQNISMPANASNGFVGYGSTAATVTSYVNLNGSPPAASGYYAGVTAPAIASLMPLFNGPGACFTGCEEFAHTKQWDITPASYVGFHSYLPWNQVTTPDSSLGTYAGVNLSSAAGIANAMTYTDFTSFVNDSGLNVCNALFLFKGAGLTNAQSYNVEISHMDAARFPANTLLAANAVTGKTDKAGLVVAKSKDAQSKGSIPRDVAPGK